MSNAAKLKKRALEYEQKKQLDKALEAYEQFFAALGAHVDEADVALFNHVGDLLLRKGDTGAALNHYERAVDLYTDGGFYNNAIALCNKILRNAPGRSSVYYKLGKISARKGFVTDAKQKFLEYADRMQRNGDFEEAFRALKEFADLCPDQDEIRLMLADQLVRRNRKDEAIEQLHILYDKLHSEGRDREAQAALERMKALDPNLQPPKPGSARRTPKANELIFLDVDYDQPAGSSARGPTPVVQTAPVRTPDPDDDDEAPSLADATMAAEADEDQPFAAPVDASADPSLPFIDVAPGPIDTSSVAPVEGFTPTAMMDSFAAAMDAPLPSTLDKEVGTQQLEQAALAGASEPTADDEPLQIINVDMLAEADGDDDSTVPSGGLDLIMPPDDAASLAVGVVDEGDDFSLLTSEPLLPDPLAMQAGMSGDAPEQDLPFIYPQDEPVSSIVDDATRVPPAGQAATRPHVPPAPERLVDRLRAGLERAPEDWGLRRRLAEALLEEGAREAGIQELETAMLGFERSGHLGEASALTEELLLVDPANVRFHQKRVEYAVRANDKGRLVDAYIALADCLLRTGHVDKARAVYQRVCELAPEDGRARAALATLGGEVSSPTPTTQVRQPSPTPAAVPRPAVPTTAIPTPVAPVNGGARPAAPAPKPAAPAVRPSGPAPAPPAPRQPLRVEPMRPVAAPVAAPAPAPAAEPKPVRPRNPELDRVAAAASDRDFVDLAAWLKDDEPVRNTRMVVDVAEPEDETAQVDFAEMLEMFKRGIEANVDEMDHESHYDLGVAYKEMGLLDEAIAEFQKALRGTEDRVRTYEALGQCFVEKEQDQIALTILSRALADNSYTDDTLVGVLYLLGCASERLGRAEDARRYYERVFAVDIQFRDVGDRLAAVQRAVL